MCGDWFIEIGNVVHGPFAYGELQKKAAAGELFPHTPVRERADGRWVFAETLQGLFEKCSLTDSSVSDNSEGTSASDVMTAAGGVEPTIDSPRHANKGDVAEGNAPAGSWDENRDHMRKPVPYGLIFAWIWAVFAGYVLLVAEDFGGRHGLGVMRPDNFLLLLAQLAAPILLFLLPIFHIAVADWRKVRSGSGGTGLLVVVAGIVVVLIGKCCRPPEPFNVNYPPLSQEGATLPSRDSIPFVTANPAAEAIERGNAALLQHDWRKAVEDCNEALRLNENSALAHYTRGNAYGLKGEIDKAIQDFTEAIRLDPTYAEFYLNRAGGYQKIGEYGKATADCTSAIRLKPSFAIAYWSRAVSYGAQGEWDKAIQDCSTAVRLDPKYATAWSMRGLAHAKKAEWEEAIADYSRAINLDFSVAGSHLGRADVYAAKHDFTDAIADYTEAIRLKRDYSEAWCRRGNVYMSRGDFEKAIADCTEAIRLNPKYAVAYSVRGFAYGGKGEIKKAQEDLDKAKQLGF